MCASIRERNEIKRSHYAAFKQRYQKALRAECYFECVLIDYAMIEDRTLSILKHAGLVTCESETKPRWVGKARKDACRSILAPLAKDGKPLPSVRKLITKLKALKVLYELECPETMECGEYEAWVRTRVKNRLAECAVPELCANVETWAKQRNTYVHALFGGEAHPCDEALRAFAEEGMRYASELDKIAGYVKRLESGRARQIAKSKRAGRS